MNMRYSNPPDTLTLHPSLLKRINNDAARVCHPYYWLAFSPNGKAITHTVFRVGPTKEGTGIAVTEWNPITGDRDHTEEGWSGGFSNGVLWCLMVYPSLFNGAGACRGGLFSLGGLDIHWKVLAYPDFADK